MVTNHATKTFKQILRKFMEIFRVHGHVSPYVFMKDPADDQNPPNTQPPLGLPLFETPARNTRT